MGLVSTWMGDHSLVSHPPGRCLMTVALKKPDFNRPILDHNPASFFRETCQPTHIRSSPPEKFINRPTLDRHHPSHMWPKMKILRKKWFFGIIWTSYSVRGTCGMHGMDMQRNFFPNQKVPVSLQWFPIDKF